MPPENLDVGNNTDFLNRDKFRKVSESYYPVPTYMEVCPSPLPAYS